MDVAIPRVRSLAEAEAALCLEGLVFSPAAGPLLEDWLAGRINSDTLDRKLIELGYRQERSGPRPIRNNHQEK